MIVVTTYEQARLNAIHILSTHDICPTTITITPSTTKYGIRWLVDYEEEYEEERMNEE